MGCVSSKLFKQELKEELVFENAGGGGRDFATHVVSLTSSTLGVLKLEQHQHPIAEVAKKSPPRDQPPEIINAWELMEGLEEEAASASVRAKRSPNSRILLRGFGDVDARSPLKFLNQMASPKNLKRFVGGKENKGRVGFGKLDYSPKGVLTACNNLQENSRKVSPNLRISKKGCLDMDAKCGEISKRRSFGPLFDPELVESFEKELCEEEEQIKKMVSVSLSASIRKPRNFKDSECLLESFTKKCPPGGENAVVIYTTTLRGIRKTFEECNVVRSIIDSHGVYTFERDVSMDSGFKEELRGLMGTKEVKVPLVFVKGRLIGGASELVRLDEEGKLEILFEKIPRALAVACQGCAGVRFVMCMDCCGSCKVLGEDGRKTVKCGVCNENGLIHCPICC